MQIGSPPPRPSPRERARLRAGEGRRAGVGRARREGGEGRPPSGLLRAGAPLPRPPLPAACVRPGRAGIASAAPAAPPASRAFRGPAGQPRGAGRRGAAFRRRSSSSAAASSCAPPARRTCSADLLPRPGRAPPGTHAAAGAAGTHGAGGAGGTGPGRAAWPRRLRARAVPCGAGGRGCAGAESPAGGRGRRGASHRHGSRVLGARRGRKDPSRARGAGGSARRGRGCAGGGARPAEPASGAAFAELRETLREAAAAQTWPGARLVGNAPNKGAARCRPRTGRAGEGEGGGGADQVGAGCADGTQPFLPTPLEFPKVAAEEMLSFLSSKEERLTEAGSHSTSRHAGADDGGVHGPLPGGAVREGEVFKAPIVVTAVHGDTGNPGSCLDTQQQTSG
ncbi:collagen, type I, alpha 1b-like [Cavia porcellus]|uniref:collagen, type I, alpha 1b-like n=1 Tax=Cavia porcellus TaxID=10141 RepID=UPI002FE14AEB